MQPESYSCESDTYDTCRRSFLRALGVGATLPIYSGLGAATSGDSREVFAQGVTVMTYNLYVGFDISRLFTVTEPEEVPLMAGQLYQEFLATDFPTRANAIAAQIAETNPDLIGLQEVFLLRKQSPGDFASDSTPNATEVVVDFLAEVQTALATRGLQYDVATESINFDVEVPAIVDGQLLDFRGTDRDIVLVRRGIQTENSISRNFTTNLTVSLAGMPVHLVRGYGMVDVTVRGRTVRFANTHLEPFVPAVQFAQAQELLADVLATEDPIVLVGDFNSAADGSTTATYSRLTEEFTDVWNEATSGPGYTCCQAPDLTNDGSQLDRRIDLVLVWGAAEPVSAERVGENTADKTASGLWPSDHAGVVATIELSQPSRTG